MIPDNTKEDEVLPSRKYVNGLQHLGEHWKALVGYGIVVMLAGLTAIFLPQVAAFTFETILAILLIVAGCMKALHVFQWRSLLRGAPLGYLEAFLAIVAGAVLLKFPHSGVITIALIVGCLFLTTGLVKSVMALQLRDVPGFSWLLLSGILSIILGICVFVMIPEAAPWIIGMLIGIDVFVGGWWLVELGLIARNSNKYIHS